MKKRKPQKLYACNLTMDQCHMILESFCTTYDDPGKKELREIIEKSSKEHNFDLSFYLKTVGDLATHLRCHVH